MSHLNLPVRRLCVQNPVPAVHPAAANRRLDAPHKVFLIYGADEGNGTNRPPPRPADPLHQGIKGRQRAGQAGLHIAGPSAVHPPALGHRSQRRMALIPSLSQGHCVHMADKRQPRPRQRAGDARHEVSSPGQHFLRFQKEGHRFSLLLYQNPMLLSPLQNPRPNPALDLSLVSSRVRAVNLHQLRRKLPGWAGVVIIIICMHVIASQI